MPRIDPQQLLKCLSVLLSSNGGIKSKDEVQRLASLMTKFSKKLVSKCIYVSILKSTETDLLIMFMSAGGWDLTYSWLSDGVAAKNWPLVTELVDLLLLCPVDIDRLKTNACPKLIKTLSKDSSAQEKVRLLACKLVEQWLRIVRGDNEASVSKLPDQSTPDAVQTSSILSSEVIGHVTDVQINDNTSYKNINKNFDGKSDYVEGVGDGHLPVYKITIRDGKKILTDVSGDRRLSTEALEDCTTGTEDTNQEDEENIEDEVDDEDGLIKPVKLHKKPFASKSKRHNILNKQTKLVFGGNKKEVDIIDSGCSTVKSPNRLTDGVKSNIKKVKAEPKPKINIRSKVNTSSCKVKETASSKNNVNVHWDSEDLTISKPKDKLSLSLKNKKTTAPIKDKDKVEGKPAKGDGKEKNRFDVGDLLTDKEKETLSKLITPPISKVGKIPKKSSSNKEEKQSEEKNRTLKEENDDNKTAFKKSIEMKKSDNKRSEKKYSISVEPKRSVQGDSRPKTVKKYNSKFRSTGLEEEVRPPLPPRLGPKKAPSPFLSGFADKKISKRNSPPPEPHVPEKRIKPESPQDEKKHVEKFGGIKLIPPKPKPIFLQESDVFMDAMLAANTMKEPRKRKRRPSTSKDSGQSDPKKEAMSGGNNSPTNSPKSEDTSPSSVKPTFKFYQDTLDTSLEDEKLETAMDEESLEFTESDVNPDELGDDQKSMSSEDDKTLVKVESASGPLKGVLVHLKTKRQKKTVSWKEDELECIKFFELDETERVNVTKNFTDMKNMERENERENLQIARKLAIDDIMEERIRWKALIPIDIAAPVVAPGKNSQEKDIQYAREKTVSAAIYFNKRTIPESPSEPDLEIHATTDPACIPMDDITGSTDSINDFTNTPWPEPRGLAPTPAPPPPPGPIQPPSFQPTSVPFPQPSFPSMAPFMAGPAPVMPLSAGGDCWRTGDGKVVPMAPEMFPPQGLMPGMPPMAPGPMMLPPGVSPDMAFPIAMQGPNPSPEEMAHFGGGFPPIGPSPPHQMFVPPPPPPPPQGPQGGNFQGSGSSNWQSSGGGNWYQSGHDNDQLPPLHNQNPPGRYQGNWRGGRGGNRNRKYSDGWGGNSNSRTPICNNILKRGFCRNNSCRFRHPR